MNARSTSRRWTNNSKTKNVWACSWTCGEPLNLLRDQYACVIMTTVVDPVDTTVTRSQLRFRSDILDFNIFPYSEKTGENVKSWLLQVLDRNRIKHIMVSGITPDGAADGQCGLRLIDTLCDKVDTCRTVCDKYQSCGTLVRQVRRVKTLSLRSSCAKMLALSCCHVRVNVDYVGWSMWITSD